MNTKKAFKATKETWIICESDGDQYYPEAPEYEDRPYINLIIGKEQQPDNTWVYIKEPIFKDLYPYLFLPDTKIHVNLYAFPPVIIEMNGMLARHNPDITYAYESAYNVMEDTDLINLSNQIRAFSDIRLSRYINHRMSISTKIVRSEISKYLDEGLNKLNYSILYYVLKDKFFDNKTPFSKYTKGDLVSLIGGILEYKKTSRTFTEPLKSMLGGEKEFSEILEDAKEEIMLRFYKGDIS